jgi:hypothetical protein
LEQEVSNLSVGSFGLLLFWAAGSPLFIGIFLNSLKRRIIVFLPDLKMIFTWDFNGVENSNVFH